LGGGGRQSTHDALFNALNGEKGEKKEVVALAWGMERTSTLTSTSAGDAVGVGAAATTTTTTTTTTKSTGDGYTDGYGYGYGYGYGNVKVEPVVGNDFEDGDYRIDDNMTKQEPSKQTESIVPNEGTTQSTPPETTTTTTTTSNPTPVAQPDPPQEDQVEFMKKLAKERAEKRRNEEETRILQQKERAALRLKELELKMGKSKIQAAAAAQASASASEVIIVPNPKPQDVAVRQRTLFDPGSGRSYSSLLGGAGAGAGAGRERAHTAVEEFESEAAARGRTSSDAEHAHAISPISSIIVTSYEDRDRGGRSNAGPRMLFDPKSGSMVTVKDRKKEMKKPSSASTSRNNEEDYRVEDEGSESKRFARSSKYREQALKKTKRGEEKRSEPSILKPRSGGNANANVITGKIEFQTPKKEKGLPRTCGVLYKRDAKGHFISADGCEGDQGYGAHSVRGGRTRNPKGYSAQKQRARLPGKQVRGAGAVASASVSAIAAGTVVTSEGYNNQGQGYLGRHAHHQQHSDLSSSNADYEHNRGLNRSHFMRKNQQPVENDSVENGTDLPSSVLDVVTGDERLDLFSGLDASPKLQATAAAWAPSEAVLALAAARAKKVDNDAEEDQDADSNSDEEISESGVHAMSAISLIDHDDESGDEGGVEASPSIGLGLGFDPSKNMDSLMMSPAIEGQHEEEDSDLADFDLKDSSLARSTSNPFVAPNGLLGASTWGTTGNSSTMGSLTDWGDLLGSSTHSKANDVQHQLESSSSFLSLGSLGGSQTTWGTGNGFTGGFNGIDGPGAGGFNGIDGPSMGMSD